MEGIDSEESLKNSIKDSIKAQKEMDAENNYVDRILEAVAKNVEVDIPQEMVDEEVERLIGRFAEQMKMQGISLDLYYQFTGSSEKELRANMEKEAYNNVLYRLMLEEIMTLEKIEVTEEEAETEAEALAEKYQMDKNDFLAQFGGIDMIQYDLEIRKVMELLKELNK
jgi:trigger factor